MSANRSEIKIDSNKGVAGPSSDDPNPTFSLSEWVENLYAQSKTLDPIPQWAKKTYANGKTFEGIVGFLDGFSNSFSSIKCLADLIALYYSSLDLSSKDLMEEWMSNPYVAIASLITAISFISLSFIANTLVECELSWMTDDDSDTLMRGCDLVRRPAEPLLAEPLLADFEGVNKDLYILTDEALYYFNCKKNTLVKVAFLEGSSFESLKEQLELEESRSASKEDLKKIIAQTKEHGSLHTPAKKHRYILSENGFYYQSLEDEKPLPIQVSPEQLARLKKEYPELKGSVQIDSSRAQFITENSGHSQEEALNRQLGEGFLSFRSGLKAFKNGQKAICSLNKATLMLNLLDLKKQDLFWWSLGFGIIALGTRLLMDSLKDERKRLIKANEALLSHFKKELQAPLSSEDMALEKAKIQQGRGFSYSFLLALFAGTLDGLYYNLGVLSLAQLTGLTLPFLGWSLTAACLPTVCLFYTALSIVSRIYDEWIEQNKLELSKAKNELILFEKSENLQRLIELYVLLNDHIDELKPPHSNFKIQISWNEVKSKDELKASEPNKNGLKEGLNKDELIELYEKYLQELQSKHNAIQALSLPSYSIILQALRDAVAVYAISCTLMFAWATVQPLIWGAAAVFSPYFLLFSLLTLPVSFALCLIYEGYRNSNYLEKHTNLQDIKSLKDFNKYLLGLKANQNNIQAPVKETPENLTAEIHKSILASINMDDIQAPCQDYCEVVRGGISGINKAPKALEWLDKISSSLNKIVSSIFGIQGCVEENEAPLNSFALPVIAMFMGAYCAVLGLQAYYKLGKKTSKPKAESNTEKDSPEEHPHEQSEELDLPAERVNERAKIVSEANQPNPENQAESLEEIQRESRVENIEDSNATPESNVAATMPSQPEKTSALCRNSLFPSAAYKKIKDCMPTYSLRLSGR